MKPKLTPSWRNALRSLEDVGYYCPHDGSLSGAKIERALKRLKRMIIEKAKEEAFDQLRSVLCNLPAEVSERMVKDDERMRKRAARKAKL